MSDKLTSTSSADVSPAPKPKRGGTTIIIIVAIVGVLLLAVFYYGILNPPSVRVASGSAPPIVFTTYDGNDISLADYQGKPVVVNFWASWCFPCREEQATLEAAWRKYSDQVQFLGLAYLDQEPNALAYIAEFDVTYPNGPDKGSRIYNTYHVQGVPETFFIDTEGKIATFKDAAGEEIKGYHIGPLSASLLENRIQQLLEMAQ